MYGKGSAVTRSTIPAADGLVAGKALGSVIHQDGGLQQQVQMLEKRIKTLEQLVQKFEDELRVEVSNNSTYSPSLLHQLRDGLANTQSTI